MDAPDDQPDDPTTAAHRGGPRPPRRRVRVQGTGRVSAPSDVIRLQVTLRHRADDVASALRQTAETVDGVGRAVREQGVGDREITSSGAGVQPSYDHKRQRTTGYESFHRLTISVRALDTVGSMVEAVAAAAGNALSIDAIALELDDRAPLERQARDAAFADARHKAEQYAGLSGARLGVALEIIEGADGGGWMEQGGARAFASAASASAMSVEAGQQTVGASVTVTFAVESAGE